MTNIIDNLGKRYTAPEDFKPGDWFYDDFDNRHYLLLEKADNYAIFNVDDNTLSTLCANKVHLLKSMVYDAEHLVKISPDKVHIVFGDMPKERD